MGNNMQFPPKIYTLYRLYCLLVKVIHEVQVNRYKFKMHFNRTKSSYKCSLPSMGYENINI